MNETYRMTPCSDIDYERIVVDVVFNDESYGALTISQDKGIDRMEVEISPPSSAESAVRFPLEGLLVALVEAKQRLIDLQYD